MGAARASQNRRNGMMSVTLLLRCSIFAHFSSEVPQIAYLLTLECFLQ
jgi:hypothetical protein